MKPRARTGSQAFFVITSILALLLANRCQAQTLPSLDSHPLGGTTPVQVTVGMYVTDLAMIDEGNESFEMQGYLYAYWHDDRLIDKTTPPEKSRKLDPLTVWNPALDIENVRTFKTFRQDFFSFPEGTVYWEEHFDAILSAEYFLRRFPFDTQQLYVTIQPALSPTRRNHELIDFAPKAYALGVSPDTYLASWDILGVTYYRDLSPTELSGMIVPQAVFDIQVKRRSGFYIWQIFLPTILMAMVPWSVFWVKTDEFDWQMKIPLTIMLAMIAFDFAVSRDLPRVNYVTFLDSILLTSFVFAFLAVVETIVVHIVMRRNENLAHRIHVNARWVVPLLYVLTIASMVPLFFVGAGRPQ